MTDETPATKEYVDRQLASVSRQVAHDIMDFDAAVELLARNFAKRADRLERLVERLDKKLRKARRHGV